MEPTTSYELVDGPHHVLDEEQSALPGHYEAVFAPTTGEPLTRFLSDKGYAGLLRLVDGGQHSFTRDELESLSTPPSIEDLLATMQAESGEGA
jgi:hypothetical protein